MESKHEPHVASTIDFKRPIKSRNGRYNFRHKDQSFSKPMRKVHHQVQPIVNPSSSFINNDNNYVDFRVPDSIKGWIDDIEIEYTLANANAAAVTINASSAHHFDRNELLENGNLTGDPVTSDETYLWNTVYLTDDELEKRQPYNVIDNDTLELDTSANTIPATSSKDYVLKIRTVLNAAKVVLAHVSGDLVIRIYSRNKTKWCNDANVGDLSLTSMKLFITEVEYHGDEMRHGALDYRYTAFRHEQTSQALTVGTTTKYITNNFHDDIYSHCFILIRANGATLGNYEDFLSASNVYLESQGNQNLHNGIQFSDSQLKRIYVDRFPNEGVTFTNKAIYCICPSSDPVKDVMNGQVHGYDVMPKNAKVCITANGSSAGTRQLDLYVVVPRLVRVNAAGQLRVV